MIPVGSHPLRAEDQYLAGVQVPYELRAYGREGAALRGHRVPAPRQLSIAEGPKAIGVPGGYELLGGHKRQGVGPIQLIHRCGEGRLYGGGFQALLGDDIGDYLRVAGGVEDGPGKLQPVPKRGGVTEVAVMA